MNTKWMPFINRILPLMIRWMPLIIRKSPKLCCKSSNFERVLRRPRAEIDGGPRACPISSHEMANDLRFMFFYILWPVQWIIALCWIIHRITGCTFWFGGHDKCKIDLLWKSPSCWRIMGGPMFDFVFLYTPHRTGFNKGPKGSHDSRDPRQWGTQGPKWDHVGGEENWGNQKMFIDWSEKSASSPMDFKGFRYCILNQWEMLMIIMFGMSVG